MDKYRTWKQLSSPSSLVSHGRHCKAARAVHAHALGQALTQGTRRRRGDAALLEQQPQHGGTLHWRCLDSGRRRSGQLHGREEKVHGGSQLQAKQQRRWLTVDEEGGVPMAAASSGCDRRRLLGPAPDLRENGEVTRRHTAYPERTTAMALGGRLSGGAV
jgi:hypothetical protein